jgi:hypothetical protein
MPSLADPFHNLPPIRRVHPAYFVPPWLPKAIITLAEKFLDFGI